MKLLLYELRKVWGSRAIRLCIAVLLLGNLFLLWRDSAGTVPPRAYRTVAADLAGLEMDEKAGFLRTRQQTTLGVLQVRTYYEQQAAGTDMGNFRQENTELFEAFEPLYRSGEYPLYTGDPAIEYSFLSKLLAELETVAAYPDFLASVLEKADKLSDLSVFRDTRDPYSLENLALTRRIYAGLEALDIRIDYTPQKGIYTALDYVYTDLFLLAAMLLLASAVCRSERDSGLLSLIRTTPAGRLHTALAKISAYALSLLAVLLLLYGVNLWYCGAVYGLGDLGRTVQSIPLLMRCPLPVTAGQYLALFLLAKWAAAFVMGLWVLLAALVCRHSLAGWLTALALPAAQFGIRQLIPAASRFNLLKYANLYSLLRTNELLGNYRSLYWFGHPAPLPVVEILAALFFALIFGGGLLFAFCRAQLLPVAAHGPRDFGRFHKTRPTTLLLTESRKLLLTCGAAAVSLLFLFWQSYTAAGQLYLPPEELYYKGYMEQLAGPVTQQKLDWLRRQQEPFAPYLETLRQFAARQIDEHTYYTRMFQYRGLQLQYPVYQKVVYTVWGHVKETPGAQFVYDTGYQTLFGLTDAGAADQTEALLTSLACALCFAGLCALERQHGMLTLLRTTPGGQSRTALAKLLAAEMLAGVLGAASGAGRCRTVLQAYGLHTLLAPACSVPAFSAVPSFITLCDLLALWLLGRILASCLMAAFCLWLGHRLGSPLAAWFGSAALLCMPLLLSFAGMDALKWLSAYPLFHLDALLIEGDPISVCLLVFLAAVWTVLISARLAAEYETPSSVSA